MKHIRARILFGAVAFIVPFLLMVVACAGEEKTEVDIDSSGETKVCSKVEHFSITVKGKLNRAKSKIPTDVDLLEYEIRIFVHPVNGEGWFRQNPGEALENWTAQAYLGGEEQYSAKHGEHFQVLAVLTKASLGKEYSQRRGILQEPDTYAISQPKTVITLRKCP